MNKALPRSCMTLALSDAERMLKAGEARAADIDVACNIAVVDAGGTLIVFIRRDGALIGSIDLAIGKAMMLAAGGKIQHTIKTIGFEEINEYLAVMRDGAVVGRAVVKF